MWLKTLSKFYWNKNKITTHRHYYFQPIPYLQLHKMRLQNPRSKPCSDFITHPLLYWCTRDLKGVIGYIWTHKNGHEIFFHFIYWRIRSYIGRRNYYIAVNAGVFFYLLYLLRARARYYNTLQTLFIWLQIHLLSCFLYEPILFTLTTRTKIFSRFAY